MDNVQLSKLADDLETQAALIRAGLQDSYVPPRQPLKIDYKDCRACHGTGGRVFGLFICGECSGMGQVRV